MVPEELVFGREGLAPEAWGDKAYSASRIESSGLAGGLNISRSTHTCIKNWFVSKYHRQVGAKNKGEAICIC